MTVDGLVTMRLASGLASTALAGAESNRSKAIAALTGALVVVLTGRTDGSASADLDRVLESLVACRPLLGRTTPEAVAHMCGAEGKSS